jgi:hypothetical protein
LRRLCLFGEGSLDEDICYAEKNMLIAKVARRSQQ